MLCLGSTRTLEREKMIGTDGYAVFARLGVVGNIIMIANTCALSALDEDE